MYILILLSYTWTVFVLYLKFVLRILYKDIYK